MHANSGGAHVIRVVLKFVEEQSLEYEYFWCTDRRLTARDLSSSQQASGGLHDEAWAGRVGSSSLGISQEVEIETGCVVTVSYLPSPDFATSSPGPGREARVYG